MQTRHKIAVVQCIGLRRAIEANDSPHEVCLENRQGIGELV